MWHHARMDMKGWDARVDGWYEASFDESQPAESLARMRELLAQHPDAGALIPTLPRYRRSLSGYAAALTDDN